MINLQELYDTLEITHIIPVDGKTEVWSNHTSGMTVIFRYMTEKADVLHDLTISTVFGERPFGENGSTVGIILKHVLGDITHVVQAIGDVLSDERQPSHRTLTMNGIRVMIVYIDSALTIKIKYGASSVGSIIPITRSFVWFLQRFFKF